MKKNRSLLLLFFSASLFWSPAIFSIDDSATFSSATLQLSSLSATQSDHNLSKVTKPAITEQKIPEVKESSAAPVAEKTTTEHFSDEQIAHLRQLFLQAEEAVNKNNDKNFDLLAEQLKEYPLYPYLQYQWLRKHLNDNDQVKQFLQQHESSRYSSILKQKWLYRLARNRQWQTFLEYYSDTSDTSLKCYHHRAQFHRGEKQAALNGAKNLWAVGRSQPKACDPLFAELKKSELFDDDLIWKRFDAALQNYKTSLAVYIKSLMTPANQTTAQLWLNLHRNPQRFLPELLKNSTSPQAPLMFSHAIKRLSSKDIHQAITLWDNNKQSFNIDKKRADKIEKRLAFKLALKNENGAYERLSQLNTTDTHLKEWQIRVALYDQNWPRVITAIEELSAKDRASEKWQYWLARAYQETGNTQEAEQLLNDLSVKRDFYGYLAADQMNGLYQLADNPLKVSDEEIEDIKNRKEFRVAFEFMVLDRINDAKKQWWHALSQLNKNKITAAAKLAQQWQWDEIAIFTIAKVKYWDDIDLRFPLTYADKIHENAALQNLNPAILFGLVRRESAFNKNAYSPAGAKGLMQIMPQTGRQIARDLKERWTGKNSLYNPVKNLKYGSYYYQKLLNQFDGNYALALAAYNAGPSKVKQWLPDETLPADIWIETIPYRETRDYVTSVLTYALIYQQRTQSGDLTMNELTGEVQPLN